MSEAQWRQDLEDTEAIVDDLLRFSKMSIHELKSYSEQNPSDLSFLDIGPISRESSKRFWTMTDRQMKVLANRGDLDRAVLNEAIRQEFVDMVRRVKVLDRSQVDRMLARAAKRASGKHVSRTYYLPCVIVGDREPREFEIGPVRFMHRDKFLANYREEIERDLTQKATEQREEVKRIAYERGQPPALSDEQWRETQRKIVEKVTSYYEDHRWIAEVKVPRCDEKVSRQRADRVVRASLDLLKVFFGSYYGKHLRLATEPGVPSESAGLTRGDDGRFEWSFRQTADWAFVDDGWFDEISKIYGPELNAANQAITTYVDGQEPKELATRWLDALHWYGEGVSERATSAKIVKYVAALERLSVTEKMVDDLTDQVTRRSALFASRGHHESMEAARVEARELYDWRSSLMHGRTSPLAKDQVRNHEMESAMYRAENLLRAALFGSLAVYVDLIVNGKSTGKDLERQLRKLERTFGLTKPPGPLARFVELVRLAWERISRLLKR